MALCALLGACEMPPINSNPSAPPASSTAVAPPPPPVQPTSTESAALRSYLNAVQASQLTQGLLRQDGGGPDTPFTSSMLARNFERIAFFDEFTPSGAPGGGEAVLRRWTGPVRFGVSFGPSVPPSQRMRDLRDVRRYAARLARVTGHPITVGPNPNFLVLFAGEDDRADLVDAVPSRLSGVTAQNLAPIRNLTPDAYCAVAAYARGDNPAVTTAAVAIIRAENPDLLRLSCIHEELAQGLGLANDSPRARPSIFNDDDEFALLTDHDEALLGMLYDERLSPGQSRMEARDMVRILARERTGEVENPA